jgi:hypothetical protein
MPDASSDSAIRRAMGGDPLAVSWIADRAATSDDVRVVVMAALLARDARLLDTARARAVTTRDRQLVEIAVAHLAGRRERVDALARDHLVDHPDSLVVSWIASSSSSPPGGREPS